jgi:hypothetical protein
MLMYEEQMNLDIIGKNELKLLHSRNNDGRFAHISFYSNSDKKDVLAIEYNINKNKFALFKWESINEYFDSIRNSEWMFIDDNLITLSRDLVRMFK